MDNKRIMSSLDINDYNKLKALADKDERSISTFVKLIILKYLEEIENNNLKKGE